MAFATAPLRNHYEGLNVFIPDENDLNASLTNLVNLYSTRNPGDKDFWLVEMSAWESMKQVVNNGLKKLPLDLDDDLYLYTKVKNYVSIFELYEIHPTRPRKLLQYGTWNEFDGLNIMEHQKWKRRRNLKVNGEHTE